MKILETKDPDEIVAWAQRRAKEFPHSLERCAFLHKVAEALRSAGDEAVSLAMAINHGIDVPDSEPPPKEDVVRTLDYRWFGDYPDTMAGENLHKLAVEKMKAAQRQRHVRRAA